MKRKKLGIVAVGALSAALVLGSIGYAYGADDVGAESPAGIVGVMQRAGGGLIGVVADMTGLDAKTVADRRMDGESFADIATAEGVAVDDVKVAAVAEYEGSLDERLASTDPPPQRKGPGGRGDMRQHVVTVLAELTGMDAKAIHEARIAGTSLAEIAESNGVDVDDFIDTVMEDAEERLQAAVDDGKLDAEDVDEKLAEMRERLEEAVDSTEAPAERGPGEGRGPGAPGEKPAS